MTGPMHHAPMRPASVRRSGRHWLALAAYLLLTIAMTWPLALNLTTAIPGDSFDGWQNYWNLWWLKVALVERVQNPFVTDLLYHPTGVGLYFHTLNPFNGVATMPIQLSMGLIPAYNAVVFLSWVLGGYGAYLLALWALHQRVEAGDLSLAPSPVSRLQSPVSNHMAAFLAGLVFTFSPFHMAHLLGHMQVMALEWIPFYVLYLLRALTQQRHGSPWRRSALMAGLFLTFTGLCDWYFVLYLFVFTALAIIWYWGLDIREWVLGGRGRLSPFPPPRSLLPPVVAGLVFLLLLAPVLVPMLREAIQFRFMVRPAADLYILSASVMDFLIPNRLHTFFRPDSFAWAGNQIAPVSERTIAIGYLPLLLGLLAVWRDRRRALLWLVSASLFLLLALGPRLHLGNITAADIPTASEVVERWTPYALLNRLVPFMRISRSVSRHALMVQLSVAVAAAVGLAALLRRFPRGKDRSGPVRWVSRPALLLAAGASLVALAEFWVAPYPLSPPDTPPFYAELPGMTIPGAVLNLPMNYDRPGYLLYQTVHQQPLTVAYISRDDPRTLTERAPVLQHFRHLGSDIIAADPAAVGLTVLHDLDVGLVVLDRYKMPGGLEREYTEQLAAAIFAGHDPLYADERLTVFRTPTPAVRTPYLMLGALHWGPLTSNGGRRQRAITGPEAEVAVRHAPASASLRLRYQTGPDASLTLRGPNRAQLALPPAPAGHTVTTPLAGIGLLAGEGVITLAPTPGSVVWVEEVGLVLSDGSLNGPGQ